MSQPLLGKNVLVTRPAVRSRSLGDRLGELGATVMSIPAIEFALVQDTTALDRALANLASFDIIIFTSVTGVEFASARMAELSLTVPKSGAIVLAVIGPATGAALQKWWRKPDVMPNEYRAEAIADALGEVAGKRVLMLRADLARPELRLILEKNGAQVDEVATYRIVPTDSSQCDLQFPPPHVITLTSAASARSLVEMLVARGLGDWLRTAKIVCIGPVTRDAVLELGYPVAATAAEYTEEGLVEVILDLEVAHA